MIKNLSGIDTNREEGRLLIAALSILTVSPNVKILNGETDGRLVEPDGMVQLVQEVAKEIYPRHEADSERESQPAEKKTFEQELEILINRHDIESCSNTPDFVLAKLVLQVLEAYAKTVNARDQWFGVNMWKESKTV